MASTWGLLLVVVSVCYQGARGQDTIQDILRNRPELSQLLSLARTTEIYAALGQTGSRFTLFAPSNRALDQLSPALSRELTGTSSAAKDRKEHLLSYHVVLAVDDPPYSLQRLQNGRVETAAPNAPKLFFRTYDVGPDKRVYINGARIQQGDIQASNGIVHIIDAVLHPIAQKKNAYALIEDSKQETNLDKSAKTFAKLLSTVRYDAGSPFGKLNSDSNYVTVFVPTDKSVAKVLTTQRLEELRADKDATLKLLKRHIIVHPSTPGNTNEGVQAVWHASLLNDAIENSVFTRRPASIDAMEGKIKPIRIGNTLYVTNECGMVKVMDLPMKLTPSEEEEEEEVMERFPTLNTGLNSRFNVMANVTVNNGVVHFVDGVLGYIYNDAIEMIQEDEDISKFKDTLMMMSESFVDRLRVTGDNIVPENRKVTIFAPLDSAFHDLENAKNIDLSQDEELREKVLNMHMMARVVNLADITNDTRIETQESGVYAQFYADSTGTYVEVDRVRARIVRADVCVKNGIIHYIDNLLGVPYRTLLDEIVNLDQLSSLDEAIQSAPRFIEGNRNGLRTLKDILEDPQESRTFFAPNNDAFRLMRTKPIGRDYLDSDNQDKLYYLILRHMPPGEFYVEDTVSGKQAVPNSDNLVVFKEDEDYIIEYNGPFGTVQARIVWRNVRLTNGVLHIIDNVLYVDNQQAFNTVGHASHLSTSFTLVAACVLKMFL